MGATSGMGREVAQMYIADGWQVGVAGRRIDALEELCALAPERVFAERIDVTESEAPAALLRLIERVGGMDVYFHSSGVGTQNPELVTDVELHVMATNGDGFVRMITTAFNFLKNNGGGRIAAITSIAGTRGLGVSPAYSSTKRMQNTYIDALAQLSNMHGYGIRFTDIRPGFVATPLLNNGRHYPMLMPSHKVSRAIYRAVQRGRRRIVIDWRFALLVAVWRLIPSWLWERLPVRN